jgi:hypothetical protein
LPLQAELLLVSVTFILLFVGSKRTDMKEQKYPYKKAEKSGLVKKERIPKGYKPRGEGQGGRPKCKK